MVFSVSPSVTVREVDLTTTIPAITTPPAAIAGVFRWGPVGERVLISSEVELANVFGTPTDFNAETFFTAADFLSYSNALYVTRVVSADAARAVAEDSANNVVFEGKYEGNYVNDLEISYVITGANGNTDTFSAEIFDDVTDQVSITFNSNVLFVDTELDLNQIDVQEGDVLQIGSDQSGYQTLEVSNVVNLSQANTVYTHQITLRQRFTVVLDAGEQLRVFRSWKGIGSVEGAPSEDRIHIIVTDISGNIAGDPNVIIEKFENLSLVTGTKTSEGSNLYYKDVLAQRSRYIRASSLDISNVSDRQYTRLLGGQDGASESTIPFGRIAKGYDLYREANEVDVSFILQGRASGLDIDQSSLANYLISNLAETRRDCVVFVSPNRNSVVDVVTEQEKLTNVIRYRNQLQNSSYWVMDSGYKYRYDKYNDVFRWVPLNGDIAGLASLVEPWESPAGYRKGRIRNVIKLAFNPNKSQRDQLYGKDINPVITQAGQGTILFGDKTGLGTATGSAFTRINVRRLFITVQKAIATISAQFLFEFNDEFTQNQFRQVVDPFLRDIQGRRGIIDFRVVSDSTVNTPQVIDSNTFRSNIFIKPSRSINFIELTFIATRTGVEFEELVGLQF
jgi:hypothetical protein